MRPTPNRVRETLFNWLAPRVVGARCLDLFAGSGALGLEALSRGAGHVTFVEQQREVARALQAQLTFWQASGYELVQTEANGWLAHAAMQAFDIVFLDPPFAAGLSSKLLALLRQHARLAPGAVIYLEQPADAEPPPGWTVHRAGRAGAVGYYLLHDT